MHEFNCSVPVYLFGLVVGRGLVFDAVHCSPFLLLLNVSTGIFVDG